MERWGFSCYQDGINLLMIVQIQNKKSIRAETKMSARLILLVTAQEGEIWI
jgi:hypothetical protein